MTEDPEARARRQRRGVRRVVAICALVVLAIYGWVILRTGMGF